MAQDSLGFPRFPAESAASVARRALEPKNRIEMVGERLFEITMAGSKGFPAADHFMLRPENRPKGQGSGLNQLIDGIREADWRPSFTLQEQ